MSKTITAIIPSGGIGARMGLPYPKQFLKLAGLPVLVHTIRAIAQVESIGAIILVAPAEHLEETRGLVKQYDLQVHAIVQGGATRQESVKAGLNEVEDSTQLVLVHDGVRPLVTPAVIRECIDAALANGAAIAAVPVKDTLKSVAADKKIRATIDRAQLYQAQTPQAARTKLLRQAYELADKQVFVGTDEASLLEHANIPVTVSAGSEENIKITRPEDIPVAEAILMNREKTGRTNFSQIKIGHGYDAHRLVPDRKLILGGVDIPHHLGLAGHSDADVLVHAFCDAILGALGEGDIGRHFPDSDPQYMGISSMKLLEVVAGIMNKKNYLLLNGDITVIAQRPKLAPYLSEMASNLAEICNINQEQINIKATTTEKMGFPGREEGIATHAVVLLQREIS